jgi:signal transduction histidine kinase
MTREYTGRTTIEAVGGGTLASMPLRSLFARARAPGPYLLDALLGIVVGVEMQVEAALADASGGERVALHAALLVLAAAIVVRRRFPLPAWLAAVAAFVVVQALGPDVTDPLVVPLFATLFMTYSMAANARDRAFWAALPLAYVAGALALVVDGHDGSLFNDVFWLILVFVGGPCIAGRLVRHRTHLQRALREKAAQAERERVERLDEVVAEERTRIAGDLHDIVAHALSEMTIQASAAGRLATRDPALAGEAFSSVETRGREALAELRRLLDVLRRGDEDLSLAPQPSLRHVEDLVARARAAGLPCEVRIEGRPLDLPAGVDCTCYRIVQQALRGARDAHAAGHADVVVRYWPEAIELEVLDDGSRRNGDGPGALAGLDERVSLYGGELVATPTRQGHLVRARLPVEPPE